MDCASNHNIFLRSTGSLACWCDAGNSFILQPFDRTVDYGKDVYLGPVFQSIRRSLQQEQLPFPDICRQCRCLAHHFAFDRNFYEKKRISVFQVEPTVRCSLECRGCLTREERAQIAPPLDLEFAVLEKILRDLRRRRIKIDNIDFQGHGEPLLSKDVWRMIRFSKRLFPGASISMCTNAHGLCRPEYVTSGIDKITFAIDGVDQASYEAYRRNGNFEKAFGFMKDFSRLVRERRKPVRTIWKYVLFAHNDSPEQLRRAQELAREAGVTDLKFIITQLGPNLSRITEAEQIPMIGNGVKVSVLNTLAGLKNIWKSVYDARMWCEKKEYEKAGHCLVHCAEMVRRRFLFYPQGAPLPEEYQAVIYALVDIHKQSSQNLPENQISDLLAPLLQKVTLSELQAKDNIIQCQAREIQRQAKKIQHQADTINGMEESLVWKLTRVVKKMRSK